MAAMFKFCFCELNIFELKLKVCRPVTSVPTNQTASVLLRL